MKDYFLQSSSKTTDLTLIQTRRCQYTAPPDSMPQLWRKKLNSFPISPRKPLRRVAIPLKLRRCMDALKRCAKEHLGGQVVIVEVEHELEPFIQIQNPSKTSPEEWKREGYPCGNSNLKSDSDDGLRSTIKWYFWSPSDTVKNCPTLEFVRTRLAPPVVWL